MEEAIKLFADGLHVDDEFTALPAKLELKGYNDKDNYTDVIITIHEGKNRQVRKMCEAVGRKVLALHRSKIGKIGVKDLELGKWRFLQKREVEELLKN